MDLSLRGIDVLVTGATGFLGSHLTRRLVREAARVHVLVRPSSSLTRLADVVESITVWRGDLTDASSIERCVGAVRPEVVFHLAGLTSARSSAGAQPGIYGETYDVNLRGTAILMDALIGLAAPEVRVVRSGGLEEYGDGPLPYREAQREAPVSAYSVSQVAATHLLQMLWKRNQLRSVTLRLALLYGPSQPETFFLPALIRACLEGRTFDMTSGEQTRDYLYVEDAVDAFIRAATTPGVEGSIVNIGSAREYRIREIAEAVLRLTGAGALNIGAVPEQWAGLARLVSDSSRAAEVLGWRPIVDLETGLQRSINWYRGAAQKMSAGAPA